MRKVDIRLHGKGNSDSHGARPVHKIISMIKGIRTRMLSMNKSLSLSAGYLVLSALVLAFTDGTLPNPRTDES